MSNNVIERDGRYFVQCLDGEYEMSREELEQSEEGKKEILAHLKLSHRMYGHMGWSYYSKPKNADFHIKLARLFEQLEKFCEAKYLAGESLWAAYKMCDGGIVAAKTILCNPYADAERENAWIARWQNMKSFLDLFPKRGALDEGPSGASEQAAYMRSVIADARAVGTPSAPSAETVGNQPKPAAAPAADVLPWDRIEALAEKIKLRKNGTFVPAAKWVPSATAGMIDALCEAQILPESRELNRLFDDFSEHYGRKIGVDRMNDTRRDWGAYARAALGLPPVNSRIIK